MSDTGYTKAPAETNPSTTNGPKDDANFKLDERLAADSFWLASWPLCELRRFDDQRYAWLMLVPRRADMTEFVDLSEADQVQLAREIKQASEMLLQDARQRQQKVKLNVGALGNVVSQLHIHVLLRQPNDPAWPGPVWGHSAALRFAAAQQQQELTRWQALL
ncbi:MULTISPECIES: HIT domain-containing protein [Idiomarina]|uniref:HIT domain-containing protein n=1 Tax=Idiomarina TaxID=135575 RepID=UPI00129BBA92|nr:MULTISPECIES: HIT family protein [Idiomarina]MRJ41116.1 HIT domain-containing protein [Idiomarina sp. FeN1]NCU56281.1 HIT domain-containing protein [Idiomarina sp. FenA--70]NCU59300.1 HIT domain-containing protein [Idiomarina sp. FenBw--71]UUN12479.1 HIT domain-containing protein [Idiomarina loihiensis]